MIGFLSQDSQIAVIGSGAWGTALAQSLAMRGHHIALWGRDEDVREDIKTNRRNARYLPAVTLSDNITPTTDIARAIKAADIVLLVTPAQALPDMIPTLKGTGIDRKIVVLCSKGIIIQTGQLLSELFDTDQKLAVLSGPTFAREVAMGLPAAATLACGDETLGQTLVQTLSSQSFRLYWSRDIIGTQITGSLKNVLAIACGIVDGLGLGDNARAALITRGMAEIARYARWRGGQTETVMGLCGLGDVVLTATSTQSRNYSLGLSLGQGQTIQSLMQSMTSVAEGVPTAKAVATQIMAHNLDMPICIGVAGIVTGNLSVQQVVDQLLQRPIKLDEEHA